MPTQPQPPPIANLLPDKTAKGDGGRSAVFSACGRFRYQLDIPLNTQQSLFSSELKGGRCIFLMLNPSTADQNVNDPTVRRVVQYARDWGFSDVTVLNLFAFRSTDPDKLLELGLANAIGPKNDRYIEKVIAKSSRIVVAWGRTFQQEEVFRERVRSVIRMLAHKTVLTLGLNDDGSPKHPLYVEKSAVPRPFDASRSIRIQELDKPDNHHLVMGDYMTTADEGIALAQPDLVLGETGSNAYLECNTKVFKITRKTKGKKGEKKVEVEIRGTSVNAARRKRDAEGFSPIAISWKA